MAAVISGAFGVGVKKKKCFVLGEGVWVVFLLILRAECFVFSSLPPLALSPSAQGLGPGHITASGSYKGNFGTFCLVTDSVKTENLFDSLDEILTTASG